MGDYHDHYLKSDVLILAVSKILEKQAFGFGLISVLQPFNTF